MKNNDKMIIIIIIIIINMIFDQTKEGEIVK